MNLVGGPHTYSIYSNDSTKIYLFGEVHNKRPHVAIRQSIPFTTLIIAAVQAHPDNDIDLYLEVAHEEERLLCDIAVNPNLCVNDLYSIYRDLTALTLSNLHIHRADFRTYSGTNLFNDIVTSLLMQNLRGITIKQNPSKLILLRELLKIIQSMRLDDDGYDDSFDFLIFQADEGSKIKDLTSLLDYDLYVSIQALLNRRLHNIGITKQFFIDNITAIVNDPDDENSEFLMDQVALHLLKWTSIILDIYILAHIFTSRKHNVIIHTGSFHTDTIRYVLDNLEFTLLETYTSNTDYIKIDALTFDK